MVAALDDRVELRLSRLRREMAQFEARFIALVFTRCIRAEHLVFGEQKTNQKNPKIAPNRASGLRSNVKYSKSSVVSKLLEWKMHKHEGADYEILD